MNALKYAVVGTGALGGFYGAMLAKAGKEVHFLFHSDYEHVLEHGLEVESVLGNFTLRRVNAYRESSKMPVCDVVLVCLKTTSDSLLDALLTPLVGPQTTVVLVQNGLGNEERLAARHPQWNIAGALAFICSSRLSPGRITHMDYGKITLGAYQGVQDALLDQICADFEAAGVPAERSYDLTLSRWKKLVWNIPYNGLCVVMDATTQALMEQPDTYRLIESLMHEVVQAANACGFHIKDGFVQAMLDSTTRMKPYAPSMKLDYDFRRPMEIDAIYTAPLQAAGQAGCTMPGVRMLERQLRYIQSRYRD